MRLSIPSMPTTSNVTLSLDLGHGGHIASLSTKSVETDRDRLEIINRERVKKHEDTRPSVREQQDTGLHRERK
jgi:hypothetical protein